MAASEHSRADSALGLLELMFTAELMMRHHVQISTARVASSCHCMDRVQSSLLGPIPVYVTSRKIWVCNEACLVVWSVSLPSPRDQRHAFSCLQPSINLMGSVHHCRIFCVGMCYYGRITNVRWGVIMMTLLGHVLASASNRVCGQ